MLPYREAHYVRRSRRPWMLQMLFLAILIITHADSLEALCYSFMSKTSVLKKRRLKKDQNRSYLSIQVLCNESSLLSVLCFLLVLIEMLLMLSGDVEPNPGPTILTVDDIALIVKELHSLRYKYEKIGKALHIPEDILRTISSTNEHAVKGLQAVIHAWITSEDSNPTWETLCDALYTLEKESLSERIRRERCTKPTSDQQGYHDNDSHKPNNISSVALRSNTPPSSPPLHRDIAQPSSLGALLLRAAKQGSLVLVRALLSHPSCDLMVRDEEGNTALHIAASSGHHEVVEELAGRYSTPTAGKNKEGLTPLHLACSKGWTKCVSSLKAMFPGELQMKDSEGNLPADLACLHRHGTIVALLETFKLKETGLSYNVKKQIQARRSSGSNGLKIVTSCLLRAAKRGSVVLVRALLSHPSCDLMARDEEGNTALHIAASSGHHHVVEELTSRYSSPKAGKNNESLTPVECPNNTGNTPVMQASKDGKVGVVNTLITQYRADSNACNKHNNSCMHLAALHGHILVIDLLVHEFGCSPHTKGYRNRTPLHYASGGGHVELVDKMISEYKCDKMARDIEGRTPLHMAALHGKKSVVKLLISKHECPVECTDKKGNTALLCASSRGHVSVVIMLHTEFGASVTVHNDNNYAAVHLAASKGHIQLLDLLVSKFYCSPCTTGYMNRSSLHMAALNGRAEVVRLLVTKYGCPVDYTAHNGCTALLFAASMGHCNVVEVLLSEPGASMEACDNNRNTAINLAALHGHSHVLSALFDKVGITSLINCTRSPLHQASSSGHLHVVKMLIYKYNCDPMAKNHEGLTPLHVAAGSGKVEVVKDLVTKYSCPVDCVDNEGNTPLHSACSSGCSDVVKLLLSKEFGAKPDSPNNSGSCAVHIAAFYGHTEVFSVLVDGFGQKAEAKGYHNRTALHYAAGGGNLEMVERLLSKYKCDPMARDDEGLTPIHIAAMAGMRHIVRKLVIEHNSPILMDPHSDVLYQIPSHEHSTNYSTEVQSAMAEVVSRLNIEVIRKLFIVTCGLSSRHTDIESYTPLHHVSWFGCVNHVRVLIAMHGADVYARGNDNQTPLHMAAHQGHKDVVKVLVDEFGCCPDVKGFLNRTPLHFACEMGHLDVVQMLLDEYKCNPMARDDEGFTPLSQAAREGKDKVVNLLIQKYKYPVDCICKWGRTPLMWASFGGHLSTVRMLVSKFGAELEARDNSDSSALHFASFHGHKDVVSLLIHKYHCNPESQGENKMTPLHLACHNGHIGMVQMLIDDYKCNPMARSEGGDTPTHLAAYGGQVGIVKLLTDVFGAFPSIKNNQGNTPMDCNPVAVLLKSDISTCSAYLHQHGIQQMRSSPHKVLLLGENGRRIGDLINAHSTYFLPQSHLKENAIFLNYVNDYLQDMWLCQYSSRGAYSSILVQTLMSGNSHTVICLVDLDRATEEAVDEVSSQVALVKEVMVNNRNLRADIIICGIYSVQQCQQQTMNSIHEQAKKMISGSNRIHVVKSMSICLSTIPPEEKISLLVQTLKHTSKANPPQMRYGSVYLLKLLLRDFGDMPCVTLTQLHAHLQDKCILSEDTQEDIHIFLKELDSLHFIMIVGDIKNPENMIIIIHPLNIMNKLNNECSKSSNPLIKKGIVAESFLSSLIPRQVATTTVFSLLERFGLPSTTFLPQKVISSVALTNTSDTFFFIPHIITDTRQSKKWFLPCDNPFTIGFSLEVVEDSDLFPLVFQYSLLSKTAQHFISILSNTPELEGHIHNSVWQGGALWALDDVEVLAEVVENGKSVVVMARSNSYCGLKCTNLVSQMVSIVLSLIHKYCSQVHSEAYIVNCDTLGKSTVPLATNLPRVEVSSVLHAINNNQECVTDNSGAKIGRQKVKWLQKFTLKGQIFAVEYMDVYHILKQVSEKWRDIGRELGVPGKMLQTLQDANLPPNQCCSKVIEEWLMYSGDEPSWYSLTEALRRLNMQQEIDKIMKNWGPHVNTYSQLRNGDTTEEAVTDVFLSTFAEVVKPYWNLLAPYVISTNYDLTEENTLQQLQTWKEEKTPTYGDLYEILNHLIINSVVIQQDGRSKDESLSSENVNMLDKEADVEAGNDEEEDIEKIEEEKQKQLLDEALKEGHIKTGLDVLLLIGAAGSGKSHYKHLCLGLPPPEVRDSTGLSEHPVRTMSLVRGTVEQIPQERETRECVSVQWHEVPAKQFIELIIEAIVEGKIKKISDAAMMAKLANKATEGLPALDMEHGLDTTEYMSKTQKESAVHDKSDIPVLVPVASENKILAQSERPSSAYAPYESNFYQELLRKLKSSTTLNTKRGRLLDVDWIYIVDSGGQPQFREMLPILVKMATACVLTLKLNVPLGKLSEVECVEKGKELCKPYLSVLTNEQIVKHCSQIVDSQTKDCKLFVVGTHRDLEDECQAESRADKNKRLFKLLKPQLGPNLGVYKPANFELIYPVNSKTPKEIDYRVVEQFRRAVHNITKSKEKVDIPLYWFLLELLLHELASKRKVLSFEGCKEEAIRHLKISEEAFPTAIEFLSKRLGTIMYFPQLPNVIFTPQALMDILSKIVKLRHLLNDNQPLPAECEECCEEWLDFQQLGIMTTNLLQTAPLKNFFSDIFMPSDFLIAMKKLLIVASIPDNAFFFPSVLEELSPDRVQLKITKSCDCLAPLVLHCSDSAVKVRTKENWLPVGSFTSLIARLLNFNKWTLCTDEMQNPTCLYRNCIQFTLPNNQPGIVTLVDRLTHMEVYLQVDPETAKRISKTVCPNIHYGVKRVLECLNYNKSDIQIAFLCPEHDNSHIATLTRSDRGQWKWICKKDRSISGELTDKQWPWLQDYLGDPKVSVLMSEVAAALPARWELFAVQVELEYECIQEIKKNYPRDNYSCFMAVFQQWNIQRTVPFTWERVISVLRSKSLQEMRVAKHIAKRFCPSYIDL